MKDQFSRTGLLFGREAMDLLEKAHVAIFGVGGVGSFVAEACARCGVGAIDLIDSDEVALSNLNRQIHATLRTVGKDKVSVMKERILAINPDCRVNAYKKFYLPENKDEFDFSQYSYVVDAVDTVTAKLSIIMEAERCGVPVISCMGAGNKLDPTRFEVADIYETSIDPLARVMRRELKKRGVRKLKVVYSKEEPLTPIPGMPADVDGEQDGEKNSGIPENSGSCELAISDAMDSGRAKTDDCGTKAGTGKPNRSVKKIAPGSTAFVPSVAGLIIGGEVVKDLTKAARESARENA
ncbi:MAG: tRNA threonylcarbamoyladenosine dehydratase [[Clostridium] aminophilum]|uniref:tRNA threonylcarbamoyladenosine dehydratase n=1 Tax=[Clostridium] aminophilum TaxID=1526 RepID=UPI0026EB8580|nr:tRNA threonylcarbamoyladenosine dehydratase [[Clostridium] aminophilum]MDD6197324.1 tRNA threonylcarbamoyladenosine dehydratase [[Clostridium] aminophilum]